MSTKKRSASSFIVIALCAAAGLVAVSIYLTSDPPSTTDSDDVADADLQPFKSPSSKGAARRGARGDSDDADDPDDEYDEYDEELWPPLGVDGDRDPTDDGKFALGVESLQLAVSKWMRDEMMLCVTKMQERGEAIPQELIDQILAQLAHSGNRLDAAAVLGLIQDDATAHKLAQLAGSPDADLDTRIAALDALARGGQKAAFDGVRMLIDTEDTDPKLLRQAFKAIAKMGGEDAARLLTAQLRAHNAFDDRLKDSITDALAKTAGSGVALAELMNEARLDGNEDLAQMVVRVAQQHGDAVEPQLRAEIQRLIEDPSALDFLPEDRRIYLKSAAVSAAAAMGGDYLDEIIRIAAQDVDGLGDIALHGLRQAKGDDAAERLIKAVEDARDGRMRMKLAEALGETKSRKATPKLVELLNDNDLNVRQVAAIQLAYLQDPQAIKGVEQRLEKGENGYPIDSALVRGLGTMGSKGSLPKLREWLALGEAQDPRWESLVPFIRNSIQRIESGNSDSTKMSSSGR